MQKSIFIGTIYKNAIVHTIGMNNYAKFSIAVNDGKDENGQRKTLWLDVFKYDKDGKLTPYLVAKTIVAVVGRITTNAYINRDGKAIATMTLWANELEFIHSPQQAVEEKTDDLPEDDEVF